MSSKILSAKFSKILIANRGEIASRVIRTAKDLGFRTVAVYSSADQFAPHVVLADEAVCIGGPAVGESYLVADKILEACRKTGADAVHPGYGFLSENAEFANQCKQAGITFIGPPAGAIELMGSKRLSKIAMQKADVPCIPGYEGEAQDDESLQSAAGNIGFPLMIKASAGGGGRGMRLVFEESELLPQIKTARSEALSAFGSGELILEKALIQPRHIEIQVFADQHGQAVYLGERDCSIQRRHQKVVEEAPSPFVDESLRQRMGQAAVNAALACQYVGAGTVEFLVDQDQNFYFLEMNTRLQVEHPVTELVTGYDLVDWQLNVACGKPLPVSQDQIKLTGHAMEVRLYAEDPANQFLPQTGKILHWEPTKTKGIRIDDGIVNGQYVSPHYDPMLAKIISYGADREEARRRLSRAMEDSVLFGVTTNQQFLTSILSHPEFIRGEATTAFIEEHLQQDDSMLPASGTMLSHALAAIILYHGKHGDNRHFNWWTANRAPWPYELRLGDLIVEIALESTGEREFIIRRQEEELSVSVIACTNNELVFVTNDIRRKVRYQCDQDKVYLNLQGCTYCYQDLTLEAAQAGDVAGDGKVRASMDGSIVDVLVAEGQAVSKGETLVILEAMKMEHPLKADTDGTIGTVNIKTGDQVRVRELLIEIEPAL
ncbi:3-methylcrotonyl-CoA carboxylase [Hahella sp. CCB-MM4]|uniref:acetyl/propionyl/methylcrotonyl-CoA carboxylase subunit alpha n=1 Tax=Hahella sp. (strain CCB-MM4) TaxID=1926491 RepID=UPI000B9A5F67|nr:acetyl/propionyl/methylcrotonyl-CoA carboxylase subunit alpha [Hahella sp. CCB-MM4]OZG71621.1 3-methylcrotonyl-CoA carboxylase [Hahella sp. CCB-MM4]